MITLVFDARSLCWLVRHTGPVSASIVGVRRGAGKQDDTIVATLTVGTWRAFVATNFSVLAGITLGSVSIRWFCDRAMKDEFLMDVLQPYAVCRLDLS
jgi:hypothetical protein